jgi:hypothetical protein
MLKKSKKTIEIELLKKERYDIDYLMERKTKFFYMSLFYIINLMSTTGKVK